MLNDESHYCPDRSDIIWLNFNPQTGHEQMGKRPAIVLSPKAYNEKVGLAIICPITSQKKNYPFEVELPSSLPVQGVILSDQVKSMDWQIRQAEFIYKVDDYITAQVLQKLNLLLR